MREESLPHITLQQLDYLAAVAEADTWADAATELGVTPSALSQGLAELERRLGIQLFERAGRRRIVAERSAPVLTYARSVLAQTGDLARWIERTESGASGALRVGMIDAAAIGHYADVLRSFRTEQPDVELTLSVAPSADLLDMLDAGRLDVAVVVRPEVRPAGIEWSNVLEEPLAVYAPPGAETADPSTWGPWVSFNATSHTRRLVARAVADAGAPFDVVAESNQPDVLREMVRLGMGWTVLPVIQAESEPAPLVRARPEPLLTRWLVAARRAGSVEHASADRLIAALESGPATYLS